MDASSSGGGSVGASGKQVLRHSGVASPGAGTGVSKKGKGSAGRTYLHHHYHRRRAKALRGPGRDSQGEDEENIEGEEEQEEEEREDLLACLLPPRWVWRREQREGAGRHVRVHSKAQR